MDSWTSQIKGLQQLLDGLMNEVNAPLTLRVQKPEYFGRGIFWKSTVVLNTMAVDGLAPCVARPSTAIVLTMKD